MAGRSLGVAVNALLQVQLGCMHALLLPQTRLYSLLVPFAHSSMADQDVKDHHKHLHSTDPTAALLW